MPKIIYDFKIAVSFAKPEFTVIHLPPTGMCCVVRKEILTKILRYRTQFIKLR